MFVLIWVYTIYNNVGVGVNSLSSSQTVFNSVGVSKLSSSPNYFYFAYGSNMCSETMKSLRKLNPISSKPAVLDNYQLKFDIPGMPLIEPSWASVEECKESKVHGVLYELTPDEFASVCRTEGVPFSYTLKRCQVRSYSKYYTETEQSAFTLIKSPLLPRNKLPSPPSQSYLNVLIRGAEEFDLDDEYIKKLKNIAPNKAIIGNGIAENMLKMARFSNS